MTQLSSMGIKRPKSAQQVSIGHEESIEGESRDAHELTTVAFANSPPSDGTEELDGV